VAEIGADRAKGSYKYKLEKKVKFLGNGFITNATGGDIWGGKLGCSLVVFCFFEVSRIICKLGCSNNFWEQFCFLIRLYALGTTLF